LASHCQAVFYFKELLMITYLYWLAVILTAGLLGWVIGRFINWKFGVIAAVIVLLIGWSAFYFKYEQTFVKNYGGVMTIAVPEGQMHISATWKEDHLWIENYDPKTNSCYFSEYSKGHVLQGRVTIENCNPILPVKR
jgi:hypothetical protein